MKVLVVAPHPDDDIIGCGGSMARHVKEGGVVSVVYMTSGDAGGTSLAKDELARLREEEAGRALALLGIEDAIFWRNHDGYLTCDRENMTRAVSIIRDKKPSLVYIPHRREAHPDHAATHGIFREAIRRAAGPWFQECAGSPWTVETILAYEVWTPIPEPSVYEDVSAFFDLKMEALRCHQSQLQQIPYDDAARALNRFRGVVSGRGDYCECFQILLAKRV